MWPAMVRRRLSVFASPTRSSLPRTTCFTLGWIVPRHGSGANIRTLKTASRQRSAESRCLPQSTGPGLGPAVTMVGAPAWRRAREERDAPWRPLLRRVRLGPDTLCVRWRLTPSSQATAGSRRPTLPDPPARAPVSGQPQQSVVEALAPIDDRGQSRVDVVEQVEVVADQF